MSAVMKKTIQNERGFVLIASMMMLVVLMIIGIAATNTTTTELQISGNSKAATLNFYEAEGTAYEGARWLKEFNYEQEVGSIPSFMEVTTSSRQVETFKADQQVELNTGIRNPTTWVDEGETGENSIDGTLNNTSYRIMGLGVSEGSSLSLNSALGQIRHKYAVVGRYNNDTGGRRGNVMIEMGVRF
jgi:Tfp pilus assembly protein PilX